jgi:hypothetical protein
MQSALDALAARRKGREALAQLAAMNWEPSLLGLRIKPPDLDDEEP